MTGQQKSKAGPPEAKADPPKGEPAPGPVKPRLESLPIGGKTPATTAILDQPAGLDKPVEGMTIAELFRKLGSEHEVTFRLDTGYFSHMNGGNYKPYENKVDIPIVQNLTVRDVLEAVIDTFPKEGTIDNFIPPLGIQVRGSQIILTKKFIPPTIPLGTRFSRTMEDVGPIVPPEDIHNMFYGPTVGISVDRKPFGEFLDLLRDTTGANIYADPRVKDKLETPITLTVNDTRLLTVLRLAGDSCELGVAVVDNVFYATTKENAVRLMNETGWGVAGDTVGLTTSP